MSRREVAPARRAAYEVVRRVFEQGAWADRALPAALERNEVSQRHRGHAQLLAYGAVQRRATTDAFAERLSGRAVEKLDAPLLAGLRLGLFELLFASGTPDYAAVDQAVELCKGGGARRGSGLVNAVLRRAARERDELLASLSDADPQAASIMHSHPLWLVERWWAELGAERTRALLAADNEAGETALRLNPARADRAALIAELESTETRVRAAPGPAPLDLEELLVVDGPIGEELALLLDSGAALPQSRASAAAVALLDPRPGERVLDLCAGPGIKTTQIAARLGDGADLVAVELDRARASQVRELAAQMGTSSVQVVEADAAGWPAGIENGNDLGAGYDRVLVDPPCSDLGTLASRPDARWRKSPELVERVVELQAQILECGARALQPGGTLVYSVCTISAAEGERQIAALLNGQSGAELDLDELGSAYPELAAPSDSRFLQTFPDRDRTDGFFFARLRRRVPA